MHEQSQVTAIIKNHVGTPVIRAKNGLLNTPPEFFFSLTLPGKGGDSGRSPGRGGRILCLKNNKRRPA
jgi:hypothetical protein